MKLKFEAEADRSLSTGHDHRYERAWKTMELNVILVVVYRDSISVLVCNAYLSNEG